MADVGGVSRGWHMGVRRGKAVVFTVSLGPAIRIAGRIGDTRTEWDYGEA